MSRARDTPPLGRDGIALAALFATSGVLHLVRPEPFVRIVPRLLPWRRGLVYVSGVAEIACAAGLLAPRTRKLAGFTSAAVLVAVYPANVTMTLQAARSAKRHPHDPRRRALLAATVARLPLQWPMVRTGLRAAGLVKRTRP